MFEAWNLGGDLSAEGLHLLAVKKGPQKSVVSITPSPAPWWMILHYKRYNTSMSILKLQARRSDNHQVLLIRQQHKYDRCLLIEMAPIKPIVLFSRLDDHIAKQSLWGDEYLDEVGRPTSQQQQQPQIFWSKDEHCCCSYSSFNFKWRKVPKRGTRAERPS